MAPIDPEDFPEALRPEVGQILAQKADLKQLGQWLRLWRTGKGLSLRAAAKQLGVSFPSLQKLETGGRVRPPSVEFLRRVAVVYDVSTAQVFDIAGYELLSVSDGREEVESAFRDLVMHPNLKPVGMNLIWLESFSLKQKRQWLEFAYMLQMMIERGEGPLVPDNITHLFHRPPADGKENS